MGRILGRPFDGDDHDDFSNEDRNNVRIFNSRLYAVQTLRINYTLYDIRRDQDLINPSRQPFVMVRSPENGPKAHPYWYAQVIGVFHTLAQYMPMKGGSSTINTEVQAMEVLWVRWLGIDPNHRSGFHAARLPKVGFVPDTDKYAFGFLDPRMVIRACHLIPSFSDGYTSDLLRTQGVTAARPLGAKSDWTNYYVGM